MLKSFKAVLTGDVRDDLNPNSGGYQAVSVGDEAGEGEFTRESSRRHEKGVYYCFWILGAGVLLSWNVLICTIPFLASFFPVTSSVRSNIASYVSTIYCFGNLFFLGLAQRHVGKTSPSRRLHFSLLLLLGTSIILTFPLLPLILPALASASSPLLLPLLLLITLLLSVSTSYLQSSVFALASLWGSKEMLAVMSGQGGIAVLVSGVQLVLAILAALRPSTPESSVEYSDSSRPSSLPGVGLWALGSLGAFGCLLAHRYLMTHPDYLLVLTPLKARMEGLDEVSSEDTRSTSISGVTRRVFRKNLLLEAAVAWVFVVTLSVFPPITTAILSVRNPTPRLLQPDIFIPLHFLLFNVGDYLGRTYLPTIPFLLITAPKKVLLLSLCRTVFIPLFLACNVILPSQSTGSRGILIDSDLVYFLILLAFGSSNGYISSLCMITSSSPTLNPKITEDEKDVAGTLAAFCLVAGLAGGSLASFGVNWLVSGDIFG